MRGEAVSAARAYYGSLAEDEKDVLDARIRADVKDGPPVLQKTGKNSIGEVFFGDYLDYMIPLKLGNGDDPQARSRTDSVRRFSSKSARIPANWG